MVANLTDAQQQIVEAPLGAALVTAGAGSGKTRVLTDRLAWLVRSAGLGSGEILALTFTNKAAKEMRERVEKMLGGAIEAFLGTFHSFCARFLYRNIDRLDGYTKDFSIYDTGDTLKAIKEVLANNTFLELTKDDVKRIESKISEIKNENGRAEDFCDGEMLRAVTAYNAFLRKNNALDFDDLLIKALEVFEKCPEILASLQGRFRYILVDEFQDTNMVQYQIVKRLAGVHKNLMVVGDEDQCIYTWRGASIDNFKRFQKDFSPKIYKLEQNFRSSKNIVELAGGLVEKNQSHIAKHLFSELPNGKIEFRDFFGAREEARYVVGMILKQIACGDARPSDFAIMIRINALSRLLEEQLRDYNAPYVVWGGFKFYERAEVKVVLNYLRVLLNPADEVALFEIINFPRRSIGDTSIEKIKELGQGFAVIGDIEKYAEHFSKKTLAGIKNFRDVCSRLSTIHNEFGFSALSEHLIGEIGLDREYERSKDFQDRERLENVYQLVLDIKEAIKQDPELTLSLYLKRATLATDSDLPEIDDRVVITTVHSAKGLEFKNVFIVGLEDGLFPISRAFGSAAEMEEERRLLYVAITRAKQGLHLSFSHRRLMWGKEETMCVPSRFLKELEFNVCAERTPEYRKILHADHGSITAKPDTAKSLGFDVSDKVHHEKFGDGVVLDVIDKNILKIRFDSVGVKMLSLAYAKIEKLKG